MNFVVFLSVGLVAGWLASVLVHGRGLGVIGNIAVGVIGSFVGGLIFNAKGIIWYGLWGTIAMSALGAVVFLFFVGLFMGPRFIEKRRG